MALIVDILRPGRGLHGNNSAAETVAGFDPLPVGRGPIRILRRCVSADLWRILGKQRGELGPLEDFWKTAGELGVSGGRKAC